jgi:hypothetical protein
MSQSSCKMFSFSCMMYRCCLCSKNTQFCEHRLRFYYKFKCQCAAGMVKWFIEQ